MSKLSLKIKKLFRVYSRLERIGEYNHELMAFQQLHKFSFNDSFLPVTIMSMSFTMVLHILNDIVINERRNIIEFGSGISTIYIAKLLKDTGIKCNFYSVDISKEWINKMKQILQKESLLDNVNFIEAKLEDVPDSLNYKNQTKWFDTASLNGALKKANDFDLVIVDGPHGQACPYSRYSAVPYLGDKLKDNSTIFIDDTDRPNEKEIAIQWQSLTQLKLINYNYYCVLIKPGSFTAEPYYYKRGPHYF